MDKKLILKCPHCQQTLYELEEREPFVAAGSCRYCGGLIKFNAEKSMFEQAIYEQILQGDKK